MRMTMTTIKADGIEFRLRAKDDGDTDRMTVARRQKTNKCETYIVITFES